MKIKTITSLQNEAYKNLLKLQKGNRMRKENVFLVEGLRSFKELVKAKDYTIQSLWIDEALITKFPEDFLAQLAAPVYALSSQMLQKASDTVTSQGILAVVERSPKDLTQELGRLSPKKAPLIVLLERIQDPGNMGTIIRTADAAGCDMIIVTEDCVDEYSPKVVRSAMGSLLHLPVVHASSVKEAAAVLKEKNIKILAGHLQAEEYPYTQDLTQGVAILVGNEGSGLSDEAAREADLLVKLPMPGQAESLNASVAAGVLLYEVVRQRLV